MNWIYLLGFIIVLLLMWFYLTFLLYKQGKYIKLKYPTRYTNQLGTSGALKPKRLPFPFNFGLSGTDRYGNYWRQFQKVIDLAIAEKDENLLSQAKKGYKRAKILHLAPILLPFLILIIIFLAKQFFL